MSAHTGKRPNIVFIITDQQRYDTIAALGFDHMITPNLDRLAARGTVFNNCFCNAPVCAPSRIGLATGVHPCNLGSLGNEQFLPLSQPTYYQRLRDHNYYVGSCGKLDLAKALNGRAAFLEHRFFGDSLPCGNESFSPSCLRYLSVQQALADDARRRAGEGGDTRSARAGRFFQ